MSPRGAAGVCCAPAENATRNVAVTTDGPIRNAARFDMSKAGKEALILPLDGAHATSGSSTSRCVYQSSPMLGAPRSGRTGSGCLRFAPFGANRLAVAYHHAHTRALAIPLAVEC